MRLDEVKLSRSLEECRRCEERTSKQGFNICKVADKQVRDMEKCPIGKWK